LQLRPLRVSDKINYKIHVIGRPNTFEYDLVGNEKGSCTASDKDQPLA
jgi:hypothetical protein